VSERRPWLTHNLKIVSAISLLQDAASELLYPILPILLTTVLGAPAAVVGAVEGIAEGVAAVTKVVAGRLSDRWRKVPLVGLGYGLAALGKVLVAAATAWPVVLLGRSVDRLGKGIRGAPRDALLVVGIPPGQRGRAFGFHRAADTAGAVIGPLIALVGYELLDHQLRPLLWIAVVPAVLSAALVFVLREPPASARSVVEQQAPHRGGPAASEASGQSRPVSEPLGPDFWRVAGVIGVFSLVNFPDALLLLRLHEIGFSVAEVILAYVAYNLVYTMLSYPAGVVADRLSAQQVFAVGLLVFAVVYAGLGLSTNHLTAWLLMAAYGAYTGLTDGVGKAWISSLLPPESQGTGQGIFQGILGGGVLVAGIWAGLAWGDDGHLPLVMAGVVAGLVGAGLLVVRLPAAQSRA
jgi:MFS family permease